MPKLSRPELIYVTGEVGVVPGTKHADEVFQAFQIADRQRASSIYVLGHLFAYGVPKDDMLVYMDRLPGRKCLVVAGSSNGGTEWDERRLGEWAETSRFTKLELWGKKFQLSPNMGSTGIRFDDGLWIHTEKGRRDNGYQINARWDAWHDRFGPGGLNSLYALSVLAEQYASGMVESEPVNGG